VKTKLLETAREFWNSGCEQSDLYNLEEEIEDYIDTYCYPDLDLKITAPFWGK